MAYPNEVKDVHAKHHTFTPGSAAEIPAEPAGYQPAEYEHQEFPKHVTRESDGVVFECADERQEQNVKEGREPEQDAREPEGEPDPRTVTPEEEKGGIPVGERRD